MSKSSGADAATAGWLALDIGGANLKAAHGGGEIRTVPFEVWRQPDQLGAAVRSLVNEFRPFERVAVTMTAELCDCYSSKAIGVLSILGAVEEAIGDSPVWVWGLDGRFHGPREIHDEPGLAAASNWLALAAVAAGLIPDRRGVLIDVGSTTTDLIPLDRGRVAARGRTDTNRLQTRELVYAGVRRTPVCALATELPFRDGKVTGLAAEVFATTLDIFLTLGDLPPDATDLATADGRPATIEAARDRIARMVGSDGNGFSAGDAVVLAGSAEACLLERLGRALKDVCEFSIGPPEVVLVAGSGEFLARRVAAAAFGAEPEIVSLSEVWGPAGSTAACACALLRLAAEIPDLNR